MSNTKKRTMNEKEIKVRSSAAVVPSAILGANLAAVPALAAGTAHDFAHKKAVKRIHDGRLARGTRREIKVTHPGTWEIAGRALRKTPVVKADRALSKYLALATVAGAVGSGIAGYKLSKKHLTKKYGKEKKSMLDGFFDEMEKIALEL